MVGYAYSDLDGNIVYKLASYIDEVNPGFFGQNRHLIVRHWKFDTEDVQSMIRMFKGMTDLGSRKSEVANFIKSIGYDLSKLKDANQV